MSKSPEELEKVIESIYGLLNDGYNCYYINVFSENNLVEKPHEHCKDNIKDYWNMGSNVEITIKLNKK